MKFGYTIMYVENIEETVAFYEKAFGLQRKFVHESGYGEMATGETKLAFANFDLAASNGVNFRKPDAQEPAPSIEIAFVTNDVEKDFLTAISAGAVEVKRPMQKPWGQIVGYVRDLNGYLIEICSPV